MPQRHRETEKNKADQQQPGAKPLKELPAIARLLPIRRRILRVPSPGRQVDWDIENQGRDKRGQEDERRRPTNKARHTLGRSQLNGVSERKDDTKRHQHRHHAPERLEQTFFDTDMVFAWQTAYHRMHEGVGTELRTGGEPSDDQTDELQQVDCHTDLESKFVE